MKKLIFIFSLIIALSSCGKKNKETNTQQKVEVEQEMSTVVDGVKFIYEYVYNKKRCARLISDTIISDTTVLLKAIKNLNIREQTIYFHIPNLTEIGEEYGCKIKKDFFLYKDPPRNKKDVMRLKIINNIEGDISNLEMLKINKNLEFSKISMYLDILENATNTYNKYNDYSDNPKINKKVRKLRKILVQTQVSVLPKLRKIFAKESKKRLWEENIKVTHSGRTLTFKGYIYANNKNIKASYEAISNILYRLRFSRINFKWSDYSEYTYYATDAPSDKRIIKR